MTHTMAEGERLADARIAMIRVENVSVHFGRTHGVYRASTVFRAGECAVLLGPNGAGKSTLLRAIATLLVPSEGRIRYDDRLDVRRNRQALRKEIGFVSHELLLYRELSGRENLELFAALNNVENPKKAADTWLDRVGLSDAGDKIVGAYSRGMKQRLTIARALLHEPSVLLLDEPLTGLDRQGQTIFWELIRWLRLQNRTIVMVTHQMEVPRGVVQRAVIMERGRIRFDDDAMGSLAELYEKTLSGHERRPA